MSVSDIVDRLRSQQKSPVLPPDSGTHGTHVYFGPTTLMFEAAALIVSLREEKERLTRERAELRKIEAWIDDDLNAVEGFAADACDRLRLKKTRRAFIEPEIVQAIKDGIEWDRRNRDREAQPRGEG